MIDTPVTASTATLDRVINNPQPKLLILYSGTLPADLEQAMKQTAKETAQKLLVVKIDTQENREVKSRYQVDGSPVVIALKGQDEVARTQQPTAAVLNQYADYLLGKTDKLPAPPKASSTQAAAKPLEVTDATFQQEVMQSDVPVLVDFWAVWCGPCRMVAPILEKLAGEYVGKIKIAKLNVDENPAVSQQYQIRSIPTMYVFKNGKVVDQVVGAAPEHMLRQFVQKQI